MEHPIKRLLLLLSIIMWHSHLNDMEIPETKPVLSCVYVVVQFCPWFKFYFPLFWDMAMYDNEFETKKNKI